MSNRKKTHDMPMGHRIVIWMAVGLVVFIVCMATMSAKGQTYGVNAAGFFENINETSAQYLDEAVGQHPWVLRVPGGAIAKMADPRVKNGWGLTHEAVDSIISMYGSDDEESLSGALNKWHRKTNEQPQGPDQSYLDDVVNMAATYPNMQVVWVANMFVPADVALYPVEYLVGHGVNVIYVEMGNETYSQLNHNFVDYQRRVDAIRPLVLAMGIPVSHPAAPGGSRSRPDHKGWNASLQMTYPTDPKTLHYYRDGRELPEFKEPIEHDAALAAAQAYNFHNDLAGLVDDFPGTSAFLMTEANTQPAKLLGGTDINAVFMGRLFDAAAEFFDVICIHNGIASDIYGIIYGQPPVKNTTWQPWADHVQGNPSPDNNTTGPCDTVITEAVYITQWVVVNPIPDACSNFWFKIFHRKKCNSIQVPVPVQVLVTPADTTINCDDEPSVTGCLNDSGTNPGLIQCRTGQNDDYLHPERYIDENGNCICDECGVEWDHRINTKFWDRIVPSVYDQTGVQVNREDPIDAYVTLLETGEVLYRPDIFHWCDPITGKPTVFSMNQEVWNEWHDFLEDKSTWTFGIKLIHRPTGLNIAEYWEDHDTVTLRLEGLQ